MQSKLQYRLLLATNNPGKVQEMTELFSLLPKIILITPKQLSLALDVEETGITYFENALIKAKAFCEASGIISIADDSGLEVEALNGAPGLYSSRYGNVKGTEQLDYLLNQLKKTHSSNRKAKFTATIVVYHPDGKYFFSNGECEGIILEKPNGEKGFGYDPLFYIPAKDKTMAQLDSETKNQISHRAKAVQAILPALKNQLFPMV